MEGTHCTGDFRPFFAKCSAYMEATSGYMTVQWQTVIRETTILEAAGSLQGPVIFFFLYSLTSLKTAEIEGEKRIHTKEKKPTKKISQKAQKQTR